MTDTIDDMAAKEQEPAEPVLDAQGVAEQLVAQARAKGVDLVGPGGLLTRLTKQVFETALEEEMADHLGDNKHALEGRNRASSRNGKRSKTVLSDSCGEVDIDVPRDRNGCFEPQLVLKSAAPVR